MKPRKSAVEATVDSVGGAVMMLFDWLASSEPAEEEGPAEGEEPAEGWLDTHGEEL